jgi:hypothetical protein
VYPFRDLNLFASMPPGLIHHQKYARLSLPTATSLANSLSAIEKSSVFSVGRISQ